MAVLGMHSHVSLVPGHSQIARWNLGMAWEWECILSYIHILILNWSVLWLDFLFIRKDYGLHRTTAPKSLCFTHVHPSTVSVRLGSRKGLQLAGSPLIAWTVTASAAVTEKVRSGKLMLQWSLITCTCTSVQSFIYAHNSAWMCMWVASHHTT